MNPPLKFINLEKTRITLAQYLVYGYISDGDHIIPPFYQPKSFDGDTLLWLLPADCDVVIKPLIQGGGTVTLSNFGTQYAVKGNSFTLKNLSNTAISADIDLTGVGMEYMGRVTVEGNGIFEL